MKHPPNLEKRKGAHPTKNEAPSLETPNASGDGYAHHIGDHAAHASTEAAMLAYLQRRLAQFGASLRPLCGDELLLSRAGDASRAVPDLRAARQILRQWEGA